MSGILRKQGIQEPGIPWRCLASGSCFPPQEAAVYLSQSVALGQLPCKRMQILSHHLFLDTSPADPWS